MMIDLFDYGKLCFVQVFTYVNENVLYVIGDIFRFYRIKTFSSDNIIDNIRIKIHMRVKFFICVEGRHIRKG